MFFGTCKGKPVRVLGNLFGNPRADGKKQTPPDILIAMAHPNWKEKLLALVSRKSSPSCDKTFTGCSTNFGGLPHHESAGRWLSLREPRDDAQAFPIIWRSPWNGWLKRSFDLLFGAAVFPPDSSDLHRCGHSSQAGTPKGPAFHVQERLGYRGRNFRCNQIPPRCTRRETK